jgi:hypothetical protein
VRRPPGRAIGWFPAGHSGRPRPRGLCSSAIPIVARDGVLVFGASGYSPQHGVCGNNSGRALMD